MSTAYTYRAQTPGGQTMDGVIRAEAAGVAWEALEDAGLHLIELAQETPTKARAVGGRDFLAFNQQLSQLVGAGLPVESGLRLIAQDLRRGRLARAVAAVAEDLERGVSLPEAFDTHRRSFPPLYGRLVEAGIQTGNLPAVLLNLSRHLELLQRLRGAIWRAAAYPVVVLLAFLAVMIFIGSVIVPQFAEIYRDFDTDLPALTRQVMAVARYAWLIALVLAGLLLLPLLLGGTLSLLGARGWLTDHVLMRLPLLGPALQRNLLARWCDLLHTGVAAGLDLPRALELAGESAGSGRLRLDTRRLVADLEAGRELDHRLKFDVLPASVPAALRMGSERADLAALLADHAAIFEQQADLRLGSIQLYLAPALIVCLGIIMGIVTVALFLPLVNTMQAIL
jgi:type II secretory pathway component PulF